MVGDYWSQNASNVLGLEARGGFLKGPVVHGETLLEGKSVVLKRQYDRLEFSLKTLV